MSSIERLFPMYTLIFFSDCLGQVSYSSVTKAVWHLFTSFHTNVKAWGSFLWCSLFGPPHIYVFWQISSPLIGFSLESNAPSTDPSSIVSLTGGDFCFMMKYKWITFCFMIHKYITFSFKLVFSKQTNWGILHQLCLFFLISALRYPSRGCLQRKMFLVKYWRWQLTTRGHAQMWLDNWWMFMMAPL